MTSKALIKTAELTRLARLAKSENVTVELEREGVTIRVMPFHGAVGLSHDDVATALDKWTTKTGRSARELSRSTLGRTHAEDVIHKYHDDLGFNPKTMNDADLVRLEDEAHAGWLASIPGTPLSQRERMVLDQLGAHGPETQVSSKQVKNCGPHTEERLKARGFLKTAGNNKFPDRSLYFALTIPGFEAWCALSDK